MSDENYLVKVQQNLPEPLKDYEGMLQNISEMEAEIVESSENFYKSHSQFMGVTLDITAITPLRSIMHTLAEIDQAKSALKSAFFRHRKNEVELKKLQRDVLEETDELEKELLQVELEERVSGVEESFRYVQGAVRKLNFFTNQYKNLMSHIGKEHISEEDYEREEIKYHIMTALKQALTAARSRSGVIDEGNHIYLFDLGIPGAEAQAEIFRYLQWEAEQIAKGQPIDHAHTVKWLEACAEKWADCPVNFANSRGFDVLDEQSLRLPKPVAKISND